MKLIGITGGVGMGKSTAQSFLAERSVPVTDTDELARLLVQPGEPALAEIASQFGRQYLDTVGSLRRKALADLVFNDATARKRLEAILHPRIRSCWEARVQDWQDQGMPMGAVIIPLLFETDAASAFDATVCVACSPVTQRERLTARGWGDAEIGQRIAAQWPVEKKISAATFVVWTDGNLESHAAQWDRILTVLRGS